MAACLLIRSYTDDGGGSDATFGVADLQMKTQHWQCLPILQLHRKHCSEQKAGTLKSGPFPRYIAQELQLTLSLQLHIYILTVIEDVIVSTFSDSQHEELCQMGVGLEEGTRHR